MNYRKVIKSNSSALAVTYGSMMFEGAVMTMLIALMAPLSQNMNVDISTISILVTMYSVGTVGTIYIGGNMSDKIGRKKIILLGLISYCIFLIGMYFTSNFYFAIVLSILAGIGHGLMDSPAISMLIDIFGDHSGPAMSMVAVFFSGGGAISTLIVRVALAYNIAIKHIYVFYLLMAIIMSYIILNAKYPKRKISELETTKNNNDSNSSKTQLWAAALFLAIITFLFSSGNSVIRTWISTYSQEVKGMGVGESVGMLTYLQVGNILGAFIFAYILTKVHSTKVMITNGLIATLSFILFLKFDDSGVILLMIVGAVLSISFSLALNIIGELFVENSGQATGVIGTASMSAGMVMTFISGRLLPMIGISKLMWLAVFIIGIATLLSIIFRFIFVKIKPKI